MSVGKQERLEEEAAEEKLDAYVRDNVLELDETKTKTLKTRRTLGIKV